MSDIEYSRELQEKFGFYLLGLVFTLLGLAVQTAKFGASDVADVLELAGWLGLFVSGLVGLWRIDWLAVAYENNHALQGRLETIRNVADAKARGVTHVQLPGRQEAIDVFIPRAEQAASLLDDRIKRLGLAAERKWIVHKWSFVLALVLLICARGYEPAAALVAKHLC